jgi:tRNA 5-methylaminomethyl-2-thiouridine biosynthesis bifunctional protein
LTTSNHSTPRLSFQKNGSPYSEQFDDIYFDSEVGYQQSEEIFICGNKIAKRILAASNTFTIAETGFGTGLNFLLTLQAYQNLLDKHPNKNLAKVNVISVEKYPLSKALLTKSLQNFPQLARYVDLLIAQYPDFDNNGHHNVKLNFFNARVTLTLIINDATQGLTHLKTGKNGLVDAWYLDGFSPAKNPDMWHEHLFTQLGRLSKPQASVATFTVAGFVKRHLQAVGFRIEKKPYTGNKKQILTGIFQQDPHHQKGYQLRAKITKPQHVSIIGGGIASACAAYALTKQGIKVTLYCKDDAVAQGGSSNAIGALYPLLHQQQDDISLFYQQAFWRAKAVYNQVVADGFDFPHQWCGLLEVSYKEALAKRQEKFAELNTWPVELIHSVDAQKASLLANITLDYGGLFMPHAGWLAPQIAVEQIINAAKTTGRLKIKTNISIEKITQTDSKSWQLTTNKGKLNASVLIVCGGAEAINLPLIKQLPYSSVQGQVTSMHTNDNIKNLSTVICHKGYLTPENNAIHCIGATFNKNSMSTQSTAKDDDFNLNILRQCLPKQAENIGWNKDDVSSSKARLRCMTPDHMPMVGAMPDIQKHIEIYPHLSKDKNWKYNQQAPVIDNLYVMMGFGARGLCSAPLAADILTADLCGTPYPVDNDMLFNLSPNRFIIRDIIKRKISS